jgi:hypothetical protein
VLLPGVSRQVEQMLAVFGGGEVFPIPAAQRFLFAPLRQAPVQVARPRSP